MATVSDHSSVSALTATNSTLTAEVAASHSKLVFSLLEITNLASTVSELHHKPVKSTWRPQLPKGHYCWTCGYKSAHSSFKCPTPAAGHEPQSNKMDTKNVSTANKPT